MKSNLPVETSPEQQLQTSTMMLAHSSDKVSKAIDGLTSSSLKRVLKLVTNLHIAEAILGRDAGWYINLAQKEQDLIDAIYAHQETTMGHQVLMNELDDKSNGTENDGLEKVDLSTTL